MIMEMRHESPLPYRYTYVRFIRLSSAKGYYKPRGGAFGEINQHPEDRPPPFFPQPGQYLVYFGNQ